MGHAVKGGTLRFGDGFWRAAAGGEECPAAHADSLELDFLSEEGAAQGADALAINARLI